jgi:hypothetical protein
MRDFVFPPWRWGIFHQRKCINPLNGNGALNNVQDFPRIYSALLSNGFRETIWQYVYIGQAGGLVRSYGSSVLEIHVRFFEGGEIYAEVEVGRSGIGHFFHRRIYGNEYICGLLKSSLSNDEMKSLKNYISMHKARNILFNQEWRAGSRFLRNRTALCLHRYAGNWLFISALMMAAICATNSGSHSMYLLIVPALIMLYVSSRRNRY